MAYRGGAGMWIAVAFLFIASGVFGGLWYQRETELQNLKRLLSEGSIDVLQGEWKNQNVREQTTDILERDKEIEKVKAKVLQIDGDLQDTKASLVEERSRSTRLQRDWNASKAESQTRQQQIKVLEDTITKVRNERNEALEKQISELKEEISRNVQRIETLTRDLRVSEEREQILRANSQKRVMELQRVNSGLQAVLDKWQAEQGRQEAMETEQYDGKVIQVDIDNKFVVVNLGKVHRVHQGMKFDVIRWRLNKWDYMGAIELTEVDSTTSAGVILDSIQQKKVCPLTGYVARDPEEKYSPYAATGSGQDRVVELIQTDHEERASMRLLDPIVVADFITNPFYSKDRVMKFVVAGDPIRYSANEIMQMITKYGGKVQERVDVDTDYLVLGRVPDESAVAESEEAMRRRDDTLKARDTAKQYGIPIMREVELFNILRH